MNKYIIKPSMDGKFSYNVSVLTSVDGENYCYCGNGRFCKTMSEATKFIEEWESAREREAFDEWEGVENGRLV